METQGLQEGKKKSSTGAAICYDAHIFFRQVGGRVIHTAFPFGFPPPSEEAIPDGPSLLP